MILTPLSKEEIEQVENSIFDLAFDLELESGIVINPVLENEAHYRYWLGALPFVFCKTFLHKIAKTFCRSLQLHFVGNCKPGWQSWYLPAI